MQLQKQPLRLTDMYDSTEELIEAVRAGMILVSFPQTSTSGLFTLELPLTAETYVMFDPIFLHSLSSWRCVCSAGYPT